MTQRSDIPGSEQFEIAPRRWLMIAAASVIIVAVCYANSLPNDFILDDYQIVAINPAIRSIAPLQLLKSPYWGDKSNSGIYRPLTLFSFSLEYPLWGRWAGGYRLTNLLLHAINGFLVFLLARRILHSASAAWATGAIYLAHPAHTEPVVGLAGRSELLAAMFFLLAWVFFRQRKTVLSAVAFFLGLMSKENVIALPAVLALEAFIEQGTFRNVISQWKRFMGVTSAAVLYLGLRCWVLGGLAIPAGAQYLDGALTVAQRELTSGRAFLKYFQLLVAPIAVTGDYDFNSVPVASIRDWVAWTGLALAVVGIVAAFRFRKRAPWPSFGILFFFVTMLPASNWIVPTAIVMSERALYLPSLGICLIAGLLYSRLPSAELRKVLAAGVMATAALLCISHNYIWRNELTYFGNMVRVLPDNIRGRQGFGVALIEAGRPEDAREQFEAGLRIRRNAPLLVGLGEAFMRIDHECSRARPVLDEAARIRPADPFAPWLLGKCLENEGYAKEAESAYQRAVQNTEFPDPQLLSDWGRVLAQNGRSAEAEHAYRRAAVLQ